MYDIVIDNNDLYYTDYSEGKIIRLDLISKEKTEIVKTENGIYISQINGYIYYMFINSRNNKVTIYRTKDGINEIIIGK